MAISYDLAKDTANVAKHGLSLADFAGFDVEAAVIEDVRFDYGERRFVAFGWIGGLPHAVVYTRRGETMRVIGFRRAHDKELRRHE